MLYAVAPGILLTVTSMFFPLLLTWIVLHIDGALSRWYERPLYESARVEVSTSDHVPTGIPLGPSTSSICMAPAQLTPFVSQNWCAARRVLLDALGSSGGFSSLLTKSALLK